MSNVCPPVPSLHRDLTSRPLWFVADASLRAQPLMVSHHQPGHQPGMFTPAAGHAAGHAASPYNPGNPHPPLGSPPIARLGDELEATRTSARLVAQSAQRAALTTSAVEIKTEHGADELTPLHQRPEGQEGQDGQDGSPAVNSLVLLTFQSRTRKLSRQLQEEVRVLRFYWLYGCF